MMTKESPMLCMHLIIEDFIPASCHHYRRRHRSEARSLGPRPSYSPHRRVH